MRVLVTGASGMLGRAVASRLVERGDRVRTFQRRPAAVPGADEVLGDLADPAAVRAAADGVEAIVHLAARVGVVGRWPEFAAANIDGVAHLIEAARSGTTSRIVHVSSPAVAHHGRALVAAGAGPADAHRARGHYARSKAAGERLALAADGPDLAVVAVRPHLVWGPGDTQLIGRVIERARTGRLPVIGSGAALVDTTYVDNAADALVAALDRAPAVHGRALVVTNGEPRPVAELLARICAAAGVAPPRMRVPFTAARLAGGAAEAVWRVSGRTDDPPVTRFLAEQLATAHWFDQRQTRALLDWRPAVPLDEGFARLARWAAAPAA